MLSRSQIDTRLAERVRDTALSPLHAMAEGAVNGAHPQSSGGHHHGEWCGSAYHEGDPDGITVVSEDKPRDLHHCGSEASHCGCATDPSTGKAHDFLGAMRQVTSSEDIGPAGLFSGKALPPDPARHPVPQLVSPERFRKGPIRDGHAADAGACGPPDTAEAKLRIAEAKLRTAPEPVAPRLGRFGKAGTALTSRLPGERS